MCRPGLRHEQRKNTGTEKKREQRNFIAHLNGNGDIKTVFMSGSGIKAGVAPGKNPRETRTLSFSFPRLFRVPYPYPPQLQFRFFFFLLLFSSSSFTFCRHVRVQHVSDYCSVLFTSHLARRFFNRRALLGFHNGLVGLKFEPNYASKAARRL